MDCTEQLQKDNGLCNKFSPCVSCEQSQEADHVDLMRVAIDAGGRAGAEVQWDMVWTAHSDVGFSGSLVSWRSRKIWSKVSSPLFAHLPGFTSSLSYPSCSSTNTQRPIHIQNHSSPYSLLIKTGKNVIFWRDIQSRSRMIEYIHDRQPNHQWQTNFDMCAWVLSGVFDILLPAFRCRESSPKSCRDHGVNRRRALHISKTGKVVFSTSTGKSCGNHVASALQRFSYLTFTTIQVMQRPLQSEQLVKPSSGIRHVRQAGSIVDCHRHQGQLVCYGTARGSIQQLLSS